MTQDQAICQAVDRLTRFKVHVLSRKSSTIIIGPNEITTILKLTKQEQELFALIDETINDLLRHRNMWPAWDGRIDSMG